MCLFLLYVQKSKYNCQLMAFCKRLLFFRVVFCFHFVFPLAIDIFKNILGNQHLHARICVVLHNENISIYPKWQNVSKNQMTKMAKCTKF